MTIALPAPEPAYRWTPAVQRGFLEHLAETGSVTQACESAGKSARAAYNLRFRRDGVAFRLGWDAAILIARARLADTLMARAIDGQEDVVERDGMTLTRRRHDNRLGMSLLARLDRMAEADPAAGTDAAVARIVSQDFDAFLDLVERGVSTAESALFVAARTPWAPPALDADGQCELEGGDDADDDPEIDDAGPMDVAAMGVWSEGDGCWRTDFPPPPDFWGQEEGRFGEPGYSRDLTDEEIEAAEAAAEAEHAPLLAAAVAARDAWFGFVPDAADEALPVPAEAEKQAVAPPPPEPEPELGDPAEPATGPGEADRAAEAETDAEPAPDPSFRPVGSNKPRPKYGAGNPPPWAQPLYGSW